MFLPTDSPRRRRRLDPRLWLAALAGAALILLAPMLARAQAGADSVTLQWTAPGDDGSIGTATIYHMKMSMSPITTGNWASGFDVPGLPVPMLSGTRQSVVVRGLTSGTTYYFAIRAEDDAGNLASISNVVQWDWVLDTAPPAAPTGLSAVKAGSNVQLSWSPNSEPDLQGYSVYRATSSSGPWSKVTSTLLTANGYLDTSPPVAYDVWYQVTATDVSDNESARSSSAHVTLSTAPPTATVADGLSPGYPNPSHANEAVCVPVTTSGTGAGEYIDIMSSGGFRIRRLEIASAPRCPDGSVRWDGRNDAGAEVAPGIYRAWLVQGERKASIKLVRQP